METEKLMTLADAEATIQHWENLLHDRRAQLQNYEQQLGKMALTSNASNAMRELARMRDDVTVAENAIVAAQEQREEVRRTERAQRARQLRIEAANMQLKAEQEAEFYNEWSPKVAAARDRMTRYTQQSMGLERQAERIEGELKHRGKP